MNELKSKYHIDVSFEYVKGSYYKQPVERCNGITYFDYDVNSFERQNWGKLYSESNWFNKCYDICKYGKDIWSDKSVMDKAFQFIYTNKSNGQGDYVPMFAFEIFLMCKGYEMLHFEKLNAFAPMSRVYKHPETQKVFTINFGLGSKETLYFMFYFICNGKEYQLPTNKDLFEKAENLELKTYMELYSELSPFS